MKKTYLQLQEEARQKAIDWQMKVSEKPMYMSELAEWNEYFRKLGKRYGLLKEFRENTII